MGTLYYKSKIKPLKAIDYVLTCVFLKDFTKTHQCQPDNLTFKNRCTKEDSLVCPIKEVKNHETQINNPQDARPA
jgi:hypothetical protein